MCAHMNFRRNKYFSSALKAKIVLLFCVRCFSFHGIWNMIAMCRKLATSFVYSKECLFSDFQKWDFHFASFSSFSIVFIASKKKIQFLQHFFRGFLIVIIRVANNNRKYTMFAVNSSRISVNAHMPFSDNNNREYIDTIYVFFFRFRHQARISNNMTPWMNTYRADGIETTTRLHNL